MPGIECQDPAASSLPTECLKNGVALMTPCKFLFMPGSGPDEFLQGAVAKALEKYIHSDIM